MASLMTSSILCSHSLSYPLINCRVSSSSLPTPFLTSVSPSDSLKTLGVSDFTCRLWGCRAKLGVRGSSANSLIGMYQKGPPPSSTSSPAHRSSFVSAAFSDSPEQPFIIGVSGGTASGKTTVCNSIIQQLQDQHRVVLLNQDSFYRDLTQEELERVDDYNFDIPEAFDTEKLLDCIEALKNGQPYQVPIYDFKTHRSSSHIFRQGILVFHDQRVRNLMNMKIFVDTDADVRVAHRLRRDTEERGRDLNSVLERYTKFVMPAFHEFVVPSKTHADIIIRRGDHRVAIDLIVQHIRAKLGQHDTTELGEYDLRKINPTLNSIMSGWITEVKEKEGEGRGER